MKKESAFDQIYVSLTKSYEILMKYDEIKNRLKK